MKNILILAVLGVAFTLSACGKSDVEKLDEESAAIPEKSSMSSVGIPRINYGTSNKKKEGEK